MSNTRDDIVGKLRKLLAKTAENGCTLAEADAAFAMASRIMAEHAIEIVADRGIDAHVDDAEWAAMAQRMSAAFREGRFEDGLTQALEEISAVLVEHFPLAEGELDVNELPDEPVVL